MDGVPQWVRGGHEPAGPRRPAARHGGGGARPLRASSARPATSTAATRPPTGSTVEGPAAHHAYDTRRLDGRDDLWPTLLLGNHQLSIAWHRYDGGPPRVPPRRRRRRAVLRPRRRRPPAHRVRPARLPHRRLPRRAARHHLPLRADRAHRPARRRGLRVALPAPRQGPARPPRPVRPRHARGARGGGGRRGGRVHRRREAARPGHPGHLPVPPVRRGRAGRATSRRCASTSRTSGRSPRPATTCRRRRTPPSWPTGFVVCTFAPRPLEEDPEALRLPFFHRNVDYDEVILYHRGEFFSRAGHRRGDAHLAPLRAPPRPAAGRPGARRGGGRRTDRASGGWPTRSR